MFRKRSMPADRSMSHSLPGWLLENLAIAFFYWLLSHGTYQVFHQMGVLPMPIWPAAALALLVAFFRGMLIAPGLALGTILANTLALHGSLLYSVCIALMNTLGPLAGAAVMRNRVGRRLIFSNPLDVLICLFAALVLTPSLTATGGIGFKWLLGLVPDSEVAVLWLKWALAHSMGTLFFAIPLFVGLALKEPRT